MNSAVIWRGFSLLSPTVQIVVVVSGMSDRSGNSKTGGMIQTYIIRDDMRPYDAIVSGGDDAICGLCPHRRQADGTRSCYVNPATGLLTIGRKLLAGDYPDMSPDAAAIACSGRAIRLGTYGDPAAVPADIWRRLLAHTNNWTGYTHQWRMRHAAAYRWYVMASCDSDLDRTEAKARGWRTFRVRKVSDAGIEPMGAREIVCPASHEAGKLVTCEDCRLCAGTSRSAKDIAIIDHSARARGVMRRHNLQVIQ
jgi:hypothetical protein